MTARSMKNVFWDELRASAGPNRMPWIICGDFNATFNLGDKNGGPSNLADIRLANSFLQELKLLEPPAVGRRFSWTNGQSDPIWVKLDRFIVNSECIGFFPKLIRKSLPRLGSDHVSIRLELGIHYSIPRPFRYELAWFMAEGFEDLVTMWWKECSPSGCGAFIIAKKINLPKRSLAILGEILLRLHQTQKACAASRVGLFGFDCGEQMFISLGE